MVGEAIFQLRINQTVNTPNGPGIVQGRMVEGGQTLIIINHDPKDPRVSEIVKKDFIKGVSIQRRYTVSQITPFK